jgi:hypothetical protein
VLATQDQCRAVLWTENSARRRWHCRLEREF